VSPTRGASRSAIAGGARRGDRVAIVLRSETITLSKTERAADRDASLSVEGVVADVRFVGAVVSYRIDLGDRELTVSRPSQTEVLAEGEPVTVAWNPQDALLLSADEERTS
jgi:ABC-type Fe3+/spermidine/putrescine transport system ATPase subunit